MVISFRQAIPSHLLVLGNKITYIVIYHAIFGLIPSSTLYSCHLASVQSRSLHSNHQSSSDNFSWSRGQITFSKPFITFTDNALILILWVINISSRASSSYELKQFFLGAVMLGRLAPGVLPACWDAAVIREEAQREGGVVRRPILAFTSPLPLLIPPSLSLFFPRYWQPVATSLTPTQTTWTLHSGWTH